MRGAEEVAGAPIVAGTTVTSKGRGKAIMTGAVVGEVLGSAGKVTAEMATERAGEGVSPLPAKAWGAGFLALTDAELVLMKAKSGLLSAKAGDEIARAPRSAVTGVTMGDGKLTAPMTIDFGAEGAWEFEIPRAHFGKARAVAEALG